MTNPVYDTRHGGPWDRGSADSYYGRPFTPHYFMGDTYSSTLVSAEEMTVDEILAYKAGWDNNEEFGDRKDWG